MLPKEQLTSSQEICWSGWSAPATTLELDWPQEAPISRLPHWPSCIHICSSLAHTMASSTSWANRWTSFKRFVPATIYWGSIGFRWVCSNLTPQDESKGERPMFEAGLLSRKRRPSVSPQALGLRYYRQGLLLEFMSLRSRSLTWRWGRERCRRICIFLKFRRVLHLPQIEFWWCARLLWKPRSSEYS